MDNSPKFENIAPKSYITSGITSPRPSLPTSPRNENALHQTGVSSSKSHGTRAPSGRSKIKSPHELHLEKKNDK